MKFAKALGFLGVAAVMGMGLGKTAHAQELLAQAEVAATPPVFLRLEVTSGCTENGAIFKVINRGEKWPRTGFLRLYYADTKTVIGERRLRLASGQKVSFLVQPKVMQGHPVAVYIEPEWYKREMEYDASIKCPQQ